MNIGLIRVSFLFWRSEQRCDPAADPEQHSFDDSAHTVSVSVSGPKYSLRDLFLEAYSISASTRIAMQSNGPPLGIAELVGNRRDGLR